MGLMELTTTTLGVIAPPGGADEVGVMSPCGAQDAEA